MLIVTHDDRREAQVGMKALVLSLERHCPSVPIVVSCPNPDTEFERWLARYPHVSLLVDRSLSDRGWNIKPHILLRFLNEGHDEVLWLDSDVILADDFRPRLATSGPEELVVSEEFYWGVFKGGTIRAELWGLRPGRPLPYSLSSGVLRVSPGHRELLEAWQALLDSEVYVRAQGRAWSTRPIHMTGDQDVLTALLGSERFSDVPLNVLERGRDIVLNVGPAGYTAMERLRNLGRDLPPFIHCTDPKPWEVHEDPSFLRNRSHYYRRLFLETCEYTQVAIRYAHQLPHGAFACEPRTWLGQAFNLLAFGNPHLPGLPLAAFHGSLRRLKRMLGSSYWPRQDSNIQDGERADGESILGLADGRAEPS